MLVNFSLYFQMELLLQEMISLSASQRKKCKIKSNSSVILPIQMLRSESISSLVEGLKITCQVIQENGLCLKLGRK